ncbi:MAG TPA: zinc-dependent alcohol dehydrogenase family protein [Polyangiaceae bacterium]|nr:zinc-dependent alcohol dehydrogenase family protein [Polyangiaceae bacterium]
MRAMILQKQGELLRPASIPTPSPGPDELRIQVEACGVCRTDLHVIDGDLKNPKLPIVPGHQIVGVVDRVGSEVHDFQMGDRVGVPWLGSTCGQCRYCCAGHENLCDVARYTGYELDGGFAEYTVADARFCFKLAPEANATAIAPLLCAGLIGYRAFRMTEDARHLGLYGFGAAAHIITQVASQRGCSVYAFTRRGDLASQRFARQLGAVWAGGSDENPGIALDAALIFAPAGELVPLALRVVRKAGIVVCAGIHMSDIPSFPYADLWGERVLRSVANLTRQDGREFLELASRLTIETQTTVYALEQTNQALDDLRNGVLQGAAVIRVKSA